MVDLTGTPDDDILVGNETADILYGFDGRDLLFGRGGDDALYGGNGNDDLYGEAGVDLMYGGAGDDVYYISDSNFFGNIGDVVWEAPGEGRDIVYTNVNYSLYDLPDGGGEIERLGALDREATTPLTLYGNNLDNEIWGNAGDNQIYGYGGHDILRGGPGDDTYLNPEEDQVIEAAGEGHDTVVTRFSIVLPDNVEELHFGGAGGTLIGNGLDNVILNTDIGSHLTLVIDGGPGADAMQGGSGVNIFFVDNPGDVILPPAFLDDPAFSSYPDMVFSTVDFALGLGQWRVVATIRGDTTPLHFDGNQLANEISGNDGDNVLDGGAGADILIGYGGADTFSYTSALGGGNVDQFVTFQPGVDRIALGSSVFTGLAAGALDPAAFHNGTVAADAYDRILYDAATGNLSFDPDGTGLAAAQLFAIVHEGISISAGDFFIL